METQSDTEADKYLVADPFRVAGVRLEGCKEVHRDRDNNSACEHKRDIVAEALGADAGEETADNNGEDEGDSHYTRFHCSYTLWHGSEVNGRFGGDRKSVP